MSMTGEQAKKTREKLEWTQLEMATFFAIAQSTISHWENSEEVDKIHELALRHLLVLREQERI